MFDVAIVGGGIHGAAVAREAATRGLSVFLAEKDDLAAGTSSRSSKLIHGGLRYLESGQFGLVREALRDRRVLLDTAPALVRPLEFLLPFYRGERRPGALVRLGLLLYDRMAGESGLPEHRRVTAGEALALEPDLPRDGLVGGAIFHDAQMDDARLVVANAVAAVESGATIRTRAAVTALERRPAGGGWRIALGGEAEGEVVEARAVVNAAGPWVDAVRVRAGVGRARALRPTRGAHLVVDGLTRGRALLLFTRRDARVFFVLPWGGLSLVGTTDTDHAAAPDAVAPTPQDVRYLWREIAERWPGRGPAAEPRAVRRTFAGLRSLSRKGGGTLPWENSREARLLEENGLVSLVGGKYTTARSLAQRAVERVARRLGRRLPASTTAATPLPALPRLDGAPDAPALAGLVRREFARTAADVVWRRTTLWLERDRARAAARPVAEGLAPLLGWDATRTEREAAEIVTACDEEERLLARACAGEDADD